ncbi:STAS domain-containing protein [Streptosporangium sp. NPDC050855]|uniref:STAS domain-containing protein n=1 Tax=Streptosporangium sp. NPDC050855 TaxID=3366194 RepID=UPI0037918930
MAVVQHRPSPVASPVFSPCRATPAAGPAGPRRTPEGETVTVNVQEQAVSGGRRVEAVLYLDRVLRIGYDPAPPGGLARLVGELDATNTRAVAQTLTRARTAEAPLVVDVSRLTFVDLGGLRMLTGLCRDGEARLSGVPARMNRLLRLLDQAEALDKCA